MHMKKLQEIIKEFGVEDLVEIVYENGTFDVEQCEKGITREGIQAIEAAVMNKLTEYINSLASMETKERPDGKKGFVGNFRYHYTYPGRKGNWSYMDYFIALKTEGREHIDYYCSNSHHTNYYSTIDVSFIPVPELLGYYVMDSEYVRENTYEFLNNVLNLESQAMNIEADQVYVYWEQHPEGKKVQREISVVEAKKADEIDYDSMFPSQEVEEIWYKWHNWERKKYEVSVKNHDSLETEVKLLKEQIKNAGL